MKVLSCSRIYGSAASLKMADISECETRRPVCCKVMTKTHFAATTHVSQNTPDNQIRNADDKVSDAGGVKGRKKLKLRLKITGRKANYV